MASVVGSLFAVYGNAWSADLVAVVDLEFIRPTDQTAAVLCMGDKESDCVVWATHNLYRAKIKKVVVGEKPRKTPLVLFGKHALKEKDFRNVTVTMDKLETKTEADPQYVVRGWAEERKFFCFPRFPDETDGFELKKEGEQSQTCYEVE